MPDSPVATANVEVAIADAWYTTFVVVVIVVTVSVGDDFDCGGAVVMVAESVADARNMRDGSDLDHRSFASKIVEMT